MMMDHNKHTTVGSQIPVSCVNQNVFFSSLVVANMLDRLRSCLVRSCADTAYWDTQVSLDLQQLTGMEVQLKHVSFTLATQNDAIM